MEWGRRGFSIEHNVNSGSKEPQEMIDEFLTCCSVANS